MLLARRATTRRPPGGLSGRVRAPVTATGRTTAVALRLVAVPTYSIERLASLGHEAERLSVRNGRHSPIVGIDADIAKANAGVTDLSADTHRRQGVLLPDITMGRPVRDGAANGRRKRLKGDVQNRVVRPTDCRPPARLIGSDNEIVGQIEIVSEVEGRHGAVTSNATTASVAGIRSSHQRSSSA